MTTVKRGSGPAQRSGLLFPDGPTRRDYRPLVFFLLGAGAVAGYFTLNRRDSVPAPAVGLATARPPEITAVPATSVLTPTAGDERIPQTWEELTASRAAALAAARPAPAAPPPEPEAEQPAPRRERERERPAAREEEAPPPAPPTPAVDESSPGQLSIFSSPWGQIIVDGRVYGNTPRLGLPIAVGQRRIRVARDGFVPFDTTITVVPNAVIRLTGIRLREQP